MKRKMIISVVIVALLSIIFWIADRTLSYRKIQFNLQGSDYIVQIRDIAGKKLLDFDSSRQITLRKGSYSYNTIGPIHDAKSTPFTVENDSDILIKPLYTASFLSEQAKEERPVVTSLLNERYPNVKNITLTDFYLDASTKWAYGILRLGDNTTDVYRFILRKDNEAWVIHTPPKIFISKHGAKDVPEEILDGLY